MARYSNIDVKKTNEKIKARKAAESVLALIQEEAAGDVDHYWKILRDEIEKMMSSSVSKVSDSLPMTDVEASRFEAVIMPYGEYKGVAVGEVPLDRLDWLAGTSEEFKTELRRYLRNTKVSIAVRHVVGDAE